MTTHTHSEQGHSPDITPTTEPATELNIDDVARRAYELYEARGREPGADIDDWLQAERELRSGTNGNNGNASETMFLGATHSKAEIDDGAALPAQSPLRAAETPS